VKAIIRPVASIRRAPLGREAGAGGDGGSGGFLTTEL